jgi:tetraacyldisaccharide 4'-kinase
MIYGVIVFFRNIAFDLGLLKSKSYNFPLIGVGNLCVGGSGKTPHVEYLLRLLGQDKRPHVLSRGYGRQSKGFIEVTSSSNANIVGDEPLQIARKFPYSNVFVCENRTYGISKLREYDFGVLILDDAFQHRYVKAGLNILLTKFEDLYVDDYLLPLGNLRESKSQSKRADIIIVTNTPIPLLPCDEYRINEQLTPNSNQNLFFSSVNYLDLTSVFYEEKIELNGKNVLLVTGIANSANIIKYISEKSKVIKHLEYSDHHTYVEQDIKNIITEWNSIESSEKLILTSEKDAVKLRYFESKFKEVPIYYLPIEIKFQGENNFNDLILNYVRENNYNS